MSLLWTFTDQQEIKPISDNNEGKWNQLAIEVQFVQLKEMMGRDFYQDVVNNPTTDANKKLIDGDTYEIDGVTYVFSGLKYILSYLLYSRYVIEGQHQDTFSGFMKQNIDDSVRSSFGERKNISNEYKRIALEHWKDIELFICEQSNDYPYAKSKKSGRINYF